MTTTSGSLKTALKDTSLLKQKAAQKRSPRQADLLPSVENSKYGSFTNIRLVQRDDIHSFEWGVLEELICLNHSIVAIAMNECRITPYVPFSKLLQIQHVDIDLLGACRVIYQQFLTFWSPLSLKMKIRAHRLSGAFWSCVVFDSASFTEGRIAINLP